ncbi:PAAR domain-containing protein [Frankia gtarii]|uniref:PAAR domain-containing protein n=1 Tax=Frankia gtarii TaxID=2950102 RepID=UPI0021BFF285|nr:PAAR domain-containing protein [Frankia gtarii]
MGAPAAVAGDQITGVCAIHQVPGPTGTPVPSPAPLPFAAPLVTGLAASVLVGGQPVVVASSAGTNTPPHVGLHVSDPFALPTAQQGQVLAGSVTVLAEGRGVAYSGCMVVQCAQVPATIVGSGTSVLVGP